MVLSTNRKGAGRRYLNMADVISTIGVSKRYTLHHVAKPAYGSIRESLAEGARGLVRRAVRGRPTSPQFDEEFWALRNVSFNLAQGERLGIIGRNGAGKSTLLKILSRITEPTEGRVEIRGRVSSLLEVGTGFHPELTGRENIFLNGTILGMRSREIRSRFDEIVDFAEIEQFLDTPVKRYSSGMYVRLAFSVAAHLDPEILIVDEVLAVGDAQFQRKCLGKMEEVTKKGRTIIFVSHNITAVTSLCTKCLLLERGQVREIGDPAPVTAAYYEGGFSGKGPLLIVPAGAKEAGDKVAILRWARLVDAKETPLEFAHRSQRIGIQMRYDVLADGYRPVPNIHVFSQGQCVFVSSPPKLDMTKKGSYLATMWIPENFLNEGVYVAGIAASNMNPVYAHFYLPDGIIFSVVDDLNDPARNDYVQSIPGVIRPKLDWSLVATGEQNQAAVGR
jgi:lipopolysaccharide transport system ATP-binding protein